MDWLYPLEVEVMTDKPKVLRQIPLLPLRGILVFPYMVIHLDVGREKSIKAIEEAMVQERAIFLATQKDAVTEDPTEDDLYSVGTVAEIKQLLKLPGGTIRVLVEGITRAKIDKFVSQDQYMKVLVLEYEEEKLHTPEVEALNRNLTNQFEQYVKVSKKIPPETVGTVLAVEDPGRLADIVASHLSLKIEDKQAILNATGLVDRLETICEILAREMEILELERKISIRVRKQMEKTQKEYYLREQMKAIQKELGEKDERQAEADELREKVIKAKFPKDVEERALHEVERLEKMPPMVAEATVVRNYLEWLLALPWHKATKDRINIAVAEEILDADHYGLRKVKERIIEYLAIRKLAPKIKGPIICFVGPPGVGKTSLAKSIARALERKFIRVSLGGVRDEAEIRGHRRTYVGAMPGRIIQGMRQAGTKNPVFLLDEIDKMNADFRGDPASALLEILDPEQNSNFSDHFIEATFDLSQVMFITTANSLHNIPRPLLDRMEVINLVGYTEEEKVKIAENYLFPKQLKNHGLKQEQLMLGPETLLRLVRDYTRESGVRNLEREIATLCRKVATRVVRENAANIEVQPDGLTEYLGTSRYRFAMATKVPEVGAATGLAWTEVGGDVLSIEVTVLAGNGKLHLTGKLGDVMKESAQAGFSYIRSVAKTLGIAPDFYQKNDIHIHVPEGAIPKDGPSAGITMATALASALSFRAVRGDVAMTGEITLRGKVLPVGGIKEKVLAARRSGLTTIILPRDNQKDIDDIPSNARQDLKFIFVEHMDEVLANALVPTAAEYQPEFSEVQLPLGDMSGIRPTADL